MLYQLLAKWLSEVKSIILGYGRAKDGKWKFFDTRNQEILYDSRLPNNTNKNRRTDREEKSFESM